MSEWSADRRVKRRVYVGASLALAVSLGWWAWQRIAAEPEVPEVKPPAPYVVLAQSGRALQERAEFFDPTPLFVPTAKNFGQAGLPERLRAQPEGIFTDFGPKVQFGETGLAGYGQQGAETPESLPEVLAQSTEQPFAGFGERAEQEALLAARAAFIEINSLEDKALVQSEPLSFGNAPGGDFAPMEFWLVVDSAGVVGQPLLVASSGREEVDGFFRDYLTQTARLGQKLGVGRYRIVVGP